MANGILITAKVPANEEKGTTEQTGSATVQMADDVEEAVQMFGADALLSNAWANWKVTLQGNIRKGLKAGESLENIATRLSSAKMGVAQTGVRIDPVAAYVAAFKSADPAKRKEMLDELKASAN